MTGNVKRLLKASQKLGNRYLEAWTGFDADGKPTVDPEIVRQVFADSKRDLTAIEISLAEMEVSDSKFDKALAKAGLPRMPRREDFIKNKEA
jgi:phosphoenolpyruvate carboxylase